MTNAKRTLNVKNQVAAPATIPRARAPCQSGRERNASVTKVAKGIAELMSRDSFTFPLHKRSPGMASASPRQCRHEKREDNGCPVRFGLKRSMPCGGSGASGGDGRLHVRRHPACCTPDRRRTSLRTARAWTLRIEGAPVMIPSSADLDGMQGLVRHSRADYHEPEPTSRLRGRRPLRPGGCRRRGRSRRRGRRTRARPPGPG